MPIIDEEGVLRVLERGVPGSYVGERYSVARRHLRDGPAQCEGINMRRPGNIGHELGLGLDRGQDQNEGIPAERSCCAM
jgi:hypothetical protein